MVGALLGRVAGELVGDLRHTLLIVVGGAALLAVGHRTPIAAMALVAETTGFVGSVELALVGIAVARGLAGSVSVSAAQRARRS